MLLSQCVFFSAGCFYTCSIAAPKTVIPLMLLGFYPGRQPFFQTTVPARFPSSSEKVRRQCPAVGVGASGEWTSLPLVRCLSFPRRAAAECAVFWRRPKTEIGKWDVPAAPGLCPLSDPPQCCWAASSRYSSRKKGLHACAAFIAQISSLEIGTLRTKEAKNEKVNAPAPPVKTS